jgi:hypothetical protein
MSLTTRVFLTKAYQAALHRDPTPAEYGRARASLNMSFAIDPTTQLTDAKARLKALFLLAEYTAFSTSNAVFIADTYQAYLDRLPTGAEVTTQTTYLGTHTRTEYLDLVMAVMSEFSTRVATVVPVGQFPTPDAGGARWLKFTSMPYSFTTVQDSHEYEDGGMSFISRADVAPREFDLVYDGLSEDEAAVFDSHFDDAVGELWGFTFRDRDGNVWADTRYKKDGYAVDHNKVWTQSRHVRLIWRP